MDESHVSPHFTWAEFACKDRLHTPYPDDYRADRAVMLAAELEAVRAACSARAGNETPLTLTSVFRTAAHNKAQCGVRYSQHLYGRAADVQCPFGLTYARFREAVLSVAYQGGSHIRYLKFYPHQGFVHLDIRPTKALVIEEAA